jgi:hypothetical protein
MQKSSGMFTGAFLFTNLPQYANTSHQDYECKDKPQRGSVFTVYFTEFGYLISAKQIGKLEQFIYIYSVYKLFK